MNRMKNVFCLFLIIFSFVFARKADYAKVISSDINSTIIDFNIDDFTLTPVQTSDGIMHLARLNHGSSLLKKGSDNDILFFIRNFIN